MTSHYSLDLNAEKTIVVSPLTFMNSDKWRHGRTVARVYLNLNIHIAQESDQQIRYSESGEYDGMIIVFPKKPPHSKVSRVLKMTY